MINVLILYYSTYGHVETMAYAAADGARAIRGTEAVVKRVSESMPRDVAKKAGVKLDQKAPIARPDELADYDAILFGTPTRYGNMAAQMRNFLDQTGGLWLRGALVGKPGSVFCSTATQHGGQETTLTPFHTSLLHLGMVIVGLPYSAAAQLRIDEITGGSPYGAATIAGSNGERQPSENQLQLIRFQARHLADIAAKLARG
jgi:NAD(P)H dehydrogenase (quinone)